MVISKTQFNRLPTKPTSVSRRLNPTKMNCNPGNFQCGASCKPIRNKRTGKDTNCKANVPLGMARTGLLWLKDRTDRLDKLNAVRAQRRATGKSRKADLVIDKKTGRLQPNKKVASDKLTEWDIFLASRQFTPEQFEGLTVKAKGRLKNAFAREQRELAKAIAKQNKEEARNAAIREEVKAMESVKIPNHFKVQKETPKGDGTSDYLIEAKHTLIKGKPNKYGSLIYSLNAPSGENAQQIFKRAIANAEKENSVIDPDDKVKTTPSKLTNQITAIPVDTASNRKPRSAAPRKNASIVEQPTRAAIQTPKPKPKPKDSSVTSRQYPGKATSKQDTLASIIVGEMFNASGNDANDSVSIWLSKMEGYNPQAAKAIEAVANAVSDADPRWILDNQDLLTAPAFKKNYPAIAKALGVDITKSEAIEETIGESKPTRKGTPKQLPWAESIMDKLLDPFNRSGLASTQNWLRQMKADGDTKRVEQIEKVLKIIDKKDAGWIINNEKRLTPKAFKDNHEMYAVQFGVIPPLPALSKLTFDQLTREIKRLRQPGAGNSQRLGWAEQELKRRSDSDSFAERLRKYKKSRHRGRG